MYIEMDKKQTKTGREKNWIIFFNLATNFIGTSKRILKNFLIIFFYDLKELW